MALALLMALLIVSIFGAMLLEQLQVKMVAVFSSIVPALMVPNPHHMLETTTIVSQHIKVTALLPTCSFLMIHSGMVNSVTMRVHVALVPTLHHGSMVCHDQDTNDEDSPIQLLELYVQ